MEKGKVSIIVPIYNVEKYLERCLMSLVSQTYTDIEILLINDGSTDHSGEICRNFADHYPQIRYFFGKVTMYPTFSAEGRNMILYFLNKHFPDPDHLVWPRTPLETNMDYEKMSGLFRNDDFKEDYKVLNQYVRSLGFNIPPLVNAYMSLSPTMRMFGTAINDEFGDVEESGILIAVDEILEEKRSRHIETYDKSNIKII